MAGQDLKADIGCFQRSNPNVDIRCFGARAVNPNIAPAAPGSTASISSGAFTAGLSSASTFQNGDGVVIYGAGAPHSMPTPSTPKVTPSLSLEGTGTRINAPAAAGSTTSSYMVVARNRNGGLTAASPAGTTTTGNALGTLPVNITSATRSGQTVTFTTSTPHPISTGCYVATCGEVFIGSGNGLSDASFYGWYSISSARDATHFTVVGISSTLLGASTALTGGTATFFSSNVVSWSAVAGAIQYYIYCDRANTGTFTLCGVSDPQVVAVNPSALSWEDFGAKMMGNFAFPAFVPTSPPVSAISDHLSTTIASGAGSTTLTLANAAGTTVTRATIRVDACPGMLAAGASITNGNGTLYIPVDASGNQFVINSWCRLNGSAYAIGQSGNLLLNDTVEVTSSGNGGAKWIGDVLPQRGLGPSVAAWSSFPRISVNTAHPGIYFSNPQFSLHMGHLQLAGVPANGSKLVIADPGFNQTFDWIDFGSGSGVNDFMSAGLELRNVTGQSPSNVTLDYVGFSPGGGTDGASHTPTFFCPACGGVFIPHSYSVHRGMIVNGGVQLGVGGIAYINGGGTPLLTVGNGAQPGQPDIGGIMIGGVVLDTIAHPCLAVLGNGNQPSINFQFGLCGPSSIGTSGFSPPITGNAVIETGAYLPTTQGSFGNTYGFASDGTVFTGAGNFPYQITNYNTALSVGTSYPLFVNQNAMPAPTCSVAAGGSLTVGNNYSFQITPIWQNGGVGNRSASSRICTPTSGNQTININWTAAPGNPKDYRIFVFVNGLASFYLNTSLTGFTSFSWSGSTSTVGGSFPGIPGGGPTMLLPGAAGVSADRYIINGNCSGASDPSICGTAASGSVVIAAGATTVTVKTTAVTANSQILLTFDSSLGTRLGVTCNTTPVQPTVSARTAGKSFVIKVLTAPTMNPACFSYTIVN